jgi:DNA-binding NtrC family response regulator
MTDSSETTVEIVAKPHDHRWFIEVQDDHGARRVPLATGRVIVGSSRSADVAVYDPRVSGQHCALSVCENGLLLEDLGSKNGTYVGGARVAQAWAGPGAAVTLGQSTLVFGVVENDDAEDLADQPLDGIAGSSMAIRRVAAQVRRLARLSSPVLIVGESGTGKELVAQALHREGPRADRPFVPLNVAALPRELVESELFGHERGAFTGAVSRRAGAFAEAAEGTLFLDEIGELPLDAQPKLLRALDGYEVRRVGSNGAAARLNTRVLAATHRPLEELVDRGLFRRDLFHRLEVFVVSIPPLRERRGDIGPIARAVLVLLASDIGPRTLTPSALTRLMRHDWPGNVRELRNVLYRAADLAPGDIIDIDTVDRVLRRGVPVPTVTELSPGVAKALLRDHRGNVSAAARAASTPRSSFRKLLMDARLADGA